MPTLINVPVTRDENNESSSTSDASETSLYDESMTLLDESTILQSESPTPEHTCRDGKIFQSPEESSRDKTNAGIPVEASMTILDQDEEHNPGTESTKDLQKSPTSKCLATSRHDHSLLERRRSLEKGAGPSEQEYRSNHESYVKTVISNFDRGNPGLLRNYRLLTPDEQANEQRRVLDILNRLGIGKGSRTPALSRNEIIRGHKMSSRQSPMPIPSSLDRERLLNDTMSPLLSPSCHAPPRLDDEGSISFRASGNDDGDPALQSDCLVSSHHSTESVEIVRAATGASPASSIYESPQMPRTNPQKRLASNSAKKGADLSRFRYNDDDSFPHPDDDSGNSLESMDDALSTRMGRLSISPRDSSPKDLFPATQSPITPKMTYGSSDSEEEETKPCHDTLESFSTYRDTRRRAMREFPVNVGMKEGATFHLEKLQVKRSEMTRLQNGIGRRQHRLINFPDPLVKYNSKHKKVLTDIVESLQRSEIGSRSQNVVETLSANVLYSLSYQQVVDLCLRLLLSDGEGDKLERPQQGSQTSIQGQTIIVVRTKDDTVTWERALRESTGCSVFNHAVAPLSERVRLSTAVRVAKFDVALTTFDALKSCDVTIPIDDQQHAIISDQKEPKGWMASRGESSQADFRPLKCKQLSVLHKVNFRRVIFVDELGRKCFLAKKGTARADAAVALRANSRLVFFCRSVADGECAMRALQKSDRRAQESLLSILHLATGNNPYDSSDDASNEGESLDPLGVCSLDLRPLL